MKNLSGNEIREMFLRFFESKGHRRVRSSSLVPHGDPTLLFTNAGMNQFKDVFLGLEKRDYSTATTAQKCVRAGGKHNDLENVGFTKRHHTFFEMLGNFSFGDYFKEKAIPYAWELVTSPEWFGIPKDKLYVTVFGGAEIPAPASPAGHSEAASHVGARFSASPSAGSITLGVDDDARKIWLEQNVPAERVVPVPGLKENFWAMGDTGPCGPCSEIFYDMGPAASESGHTDCQFPCDCGRYVEIWNLVFMQFNRDARGTLTPLPKPCVDTGMGLERTAAVLQGVISNYSTDLFGPLIYAAKQYIHRGVEDTEGTRASLRIIADHSRATCFLICDGVLPSNEGRGYVLRKIMRRALRHAGLLGENLFVLSNMARTVAYEMKSAYPELSESIKRIEQIIHAEEERFARTVQIGARKLNEFIDPLVRERRKQKEGRAQVKQALSLEAIGKSGSISSVSALVNRYQVPFEWVEEDAREAGVTLQANPERFPPASVAPLAGDLAFKLYDTYGLARDFIEDVARDEGVHVDWPGFDKAMEEQRTRARASWKGGSKETPSPAYTKIAERFSTEKDFYHGTCAKDCRIEAILYTGNAPQSREAELREWYDKATGREAEPKKTERYERGTPVNELKAGESGEVVLDRTVIYAESGGQMADTGTFYDASESQLLAEVTGAYYPVAGLVAHKVIAKETLRLGDRVTVIADAERRARIIRNHSGTHLVHAALRNILGTHVKQAGSLNSPERLRFDFSHFAHVDPEELKDIEQQVNDEIRHNTQLETNIASLEDALASGALAFFGDKYPEHNVRVVTIPDERDPRGFYSKELCGGTHVHRIGDIGVLKIVSEGSVAAGVRRIEAVTGIGALEHYEQQAQVLAEVASHLNVGEEAVLATVEKLANTVKTLEKELESQKRKGALGQLDSLASQVQTIKGVKVVAAEVTGTDREGLRQLVDSLRQKIGSGVVALGMPEDGKVALIAGVTRDLTAKVHAGKMIQTLSAKLGGKGGGRPDLAEGGGTDTAALKSALSTIPAYLEPLL